MTTTNPLSDDRCRDTFVPGYGWLRVPRHISRIDIDYKHTHGWQVRYDKPSRSFSDGNHQDPARSLRQAGRYLRSIYRGEAKGSARGRPRSHTRGQCGIRVFCDSRGIWYAEAMHPYRQAPHRVYIGTRTTYSDARRRRAETAVRQWRRDWLASHPVPTR